MRVGFRVYANLIAFVVISLLLVALGATNLVINQPADSTLRAEFSDASGLLPRNDVTMRGVVVGSVRDVELSDSGNVLVSMNLGPEVVVPSGTVAEIVRRSPIGELTVELKPGNGEALNDGATIPLADTVPPPDVAKTIEVLADVLHEVPSDQLSSLVSELDRALRGRGNDLAGFSEDAADLPERLLEVSRELDELIRTSPEVTGVFADNAATLADDITQTALLADVLRDRRHDLVSLYRNGATFTEVAGGLISDEKANLSCLVSDFADVNTVLARSDHLTDLAATLDKNHFFFDGVEQVVLKGLDGSHWFRVQLLPHTEPQASSYAPHREVPDVYPGKACRSRFGKGVGASAQPDPPTLVRESTLKPRR